MKTLALLSLSLAVALGRPPLPPDVAPNPVLIKVEQSPLLGDSVPVQGHVVVEDPAPQASSLSFKEQQEKMAPVDVKQSQSMVELEVKVKPEVTREQELKPEVKAEPKVEVEQAGMVELEVKVKPEIKEEPEVQVEPEVKLEEFKSEPEVRVGQEGMVELEVKVKPQVKVEPEVQMEPEVKMKPKVEIEPEIIADPNFKVESEVKVEPNVLMEPELEKEPMLRELDEKLQVKMHLEPETDPGLAMEERHADMEGKSEIMGEPVMELEPLDDDNMFGEEESDKELSEVEKSLVAAFQSQDPVAELLPEEEKGFMRKSNHVLNDELIMELEPEVMEESVHNKEAIPDAAILEEGLALDIMGQPMSLFENYFPNEEARVQMRPERQEEFLTVDGLDFLMTEEAESKLNKDGESPEQSFDELAIEDRPVLDGGAEIGVASDRERRAVMMTREGDKHPVERRLLPKQDKQGQSCCPGVVLEGKCYQFFRGPKKPADAEFFCQENFPGGHLASITSQYIHREVMNMMLKQNGAYTRTWIGGLRYLDTGRFIWLDGSRWDYADWLSGEPNDTAGVEDCLEVLALGNGKFNDFTCWEPQAFICSYPH